MRLDAFLRNAGIVPRRPLAKRACDAGLVLLDGRAAKASAEVREGMELTVNLGMKTETYRVLALPERPVPKAQRGECAELLPTQRRSQGL